MAELLVEGVVTRLCLLKQYTSCIEDTRMSQLLHPTTLGRSFGVDLRHNFAAEVRKGPCIVYAGMG